MSWASAGSSGFRCKKGTPFAAQAAGAARRAIDQGMRQLEVMVCGPGRVETAIRALQRQGWKYADSRYYPHPLIMAAVR